MRDWEWQDMIGRITDELRECGQGSAVTLGGLLQAAGCGADGFAESEIDKLQDALVKEAGESRIFLEARSPQGGRGRPAAGREFTVYNANAYVICPRCGSKETVRMARGGRTRKCSDCGKTFGRPPLITARGAQDGEDYRDAVTMIAFTLYGSEGACTGIRISRKKQGAVVQVTETAPDGQESDGSGSAGTGTVTEEITDEKWDGMVNSLFQHLYLHEWNKNYDNRFVPSAPHWELRLRLTGRRVRSWHGSTALTPYYKDLLKLMLQVF